MVFEFSGRTKPGIRKVRLLRFLRIIKQLCTSYSRPRVITLLRPDNCDVSLLKSP